MNEKPKTQVLIAMPLRRFDPKNAGQDVPEHAQKLLADLANSPDLPWVFEMMTFGGGNVARGRNKIIASFLRGPWKWLVWNDDDVLLTAQDVVDLLSRRLMVVGGLYTTKDEENPHWVLNSYREAEIDATGLLRVPELGTGAGKVYHRSAFEKLIRAEPGLAYVCDDSAAPEWGIFQMGVVNVDGKMRWLPEDFWCDQLCRRHGIPVFVDTKVRVRHLGQDGQTYPINDAWPRLPGPMSPITPPASTEAVPAAPLVGRLTICIQFWQGDRDAAFRLAKFITDLETAPRMDTQIVFLHRHDTTMDDTVTDYVRRRFETRVVRAPEHEVGYPRSPNVMALYAMEEAPNWGGAAVFLMEADCIPVASDWIDKLRAEAGRAWATGSAVVGSWRPECSAVGHINGNMLFRPDILSLLKMSTTVPKKAWDVYFVPQFATAWMRTGLIANRYCEMFVTDENLATPECGTRAPVVIHGIKDDSSWTYARRLLDVKA